MYVKHLKSYRRIFTAMTGNIYINGVIGTFLDESGNIAERGVELLDVILQVKNQPKADFFNVYINSPGGYVDTGFEIYDYLRSLNKPINTIGQGMVASIATVIFMAGDKRMLRPNTEFIIHLPSGGVEGNSEDIDNYAKMIKDVEKRVLKFYETTAGLSEAEVLPLLRKETFLTTDEAYKIGFATEKTTSPEVVAYFKNNKSKQKQMSKNEKGLWSKIMDILKAEQITNKIVFDAESNELDFYELEDSATIEVGAKANYDGKAANGEYKVPSEEDANVILTYVFENGVLTEIKEPEVIEEEAEESEEMKALKEENEALKTQLAEYDGKVIDLTNEVTALKESNKSHKKAIAAIKALENSDPKQELKQKENPATEAKVNGLSAGILNLMKTKNKN